MLCTEEVRCRVPATLRVSMQGYKNYAFDLGSVVASFSWPLRDFGLQRRQAEARFFHMQYMSSTLTPEETPLRN